MNICCVDIETLSDAPNAAIIQIGAVTADTATGVIHTDVFLRNVEFGSVSGQRADVWSYNFDVDPSTVAWWLQQNENARQSLFTPKPETIEQVLQALANYYRQHECEELWCHGTFDAPILSNAFRRAGSFEGIEAPWGRRDVRDIRTLIAIAKRLGINWQKDDKRNTHNALDDARYQMEYILDLLAKIGS